MSLEEDLYCKVYANAAMTRAALVAWLASQLSAVQDGWGVLTPDMEVRCFESDVYDPSRCDEPKGYLYSRFYLEIYPEEPIDPKRYMQRVACLLELCWDNGIRAVAACDFEEELPRKGGIGSQ